MPSLYDVFFRMQYLIRKNMEKMPETFRPSLLR